MARQCTAQRSKNIIPDEVMAVPLADYLLIAVSTDDQAKSRYLPFDDNQLNTDEIKNTEKESVLMCAQFISAALDR
jgi:hypothetical protein